MVLPIATLFFMGGNNVWFGTLYRIVPVVDNSRREEYMVKTAPSSFREK